MEYGARARAINLYEKSIENLRAFVSTTSPSAIFNELIRSFVPRRSIVLNLSFTCVLTRVRDKQSRIDAVSFHQTIVRTTSSFIFRVR